MMMAYNYSRNAIFPGPDVPFIHILINFACAVNNFSAYSQNAPMNAVQKLLSKYLKPNELTSHSKL